MSIKHTSLAEVRLTIRREIANEELFLERCKKSQLQAHLIGETKAKAHIEAYRAVLYWLADLEA